MRSIIIRLLDIFRFAVNDFKSKYAGSAFGALWAIAEPLVTVAIYRFVYAVAFGGNDISGIPYYLWLSVGLASWMFISDGLRNVCSSFREYSFLVKKMRFNKGILPDVRCVSSLFSHVLFLAIVVIAAALNHISISGFLGLIAMVIICYAYVLSFGRVMSLLCGYYKDVQNILSVALNIGFWVTPIFWNADLLDTNIKRIIELNPAALIAEGYRNTLLFGKFIEPVKLFYLISVIIIIYIISKILEKKMLPNIADKL